VPKADIARQERLGDRHPERFGGREVDDKLELGRLLHRYVAGLQA
jgi:hypothetical protein